MKQTEYQIRKDLQLKNVNSDFTFSKQMQNAAINQMWKNKTSVWKLLEGSCDQAAKKCYQKINSLTSDIADIDTCNIHSLLSIAKSINADDLVSNLLQEYGDLDIEQMIHLFSIKREKILLENSTLDDSSNNKISGTLLLRGINIQLDDYPVDLLIDIKNNVKHLYNIFKINYITPENATLLDLLHNNLKGVNLQQLKNTPDQDIKEDDPIQVKLYKKLKKLTLSDILNKIYNYESFDLIKLFTTQNIIITDLTQHQIIQKQPQWNKNTFINYFYLLINIVKQNYFKSDYNYLFKTIYTNTENQKVINLSKLIYNIVGTYHNNYIAYTQNVIVYHFFNTILSKIISQNLMDLYQYHFKENYGYVFQMKQSIVSDMDEEKFKLKLLEYMNNEDEVQKFIELNNITKYKKDIITFVKFAFFFNQLQQIKDKKKIKVYQFDIRKINFPGYFVDNQFNDYLYGRNGMTYLLARKYTDISLQIQNIREQLKQLVQQYSYIGTRQIATDMLYQFFIKNYSKNTSVGYTIQDKNLGAFEKLLVASGNVEKNNVLFVNLSSITSGDIPQLSSIQRSYNELVYGTQSLGDDNFSINIIEYYDDTNYLNIQAATPSTLVDSKIVDYVSGITYQLDQNSIIVSSVVETPVYQNFYSPCSEFLPACNDRFWNSTTITLNSQLKSSVSDNQFYLDLYDQFDKNLIKGSIDVYKESYINESLKPLFNKIWDTFALSSISEDQLDTDAGILYKEYIGNGLGNNNLMNHANKSFPTIAAFQNINGLIQIDQNDKENILFIAKIYYQNVFNEVKKATLKILQMYNNDGVPVDGWKRQNVNFHGYANSYQQSDNRLPFSLKSSKLYKNNGPFVYSKLQEVLYQNHVSGKVDIEKLMNQYCKISAYPMISGFYDLYLNGSLSGFIFNKENGISSYKISNYQEDRFDNCFTLFKKSNETSGILTYRSYKMPISIKLMDSLSSVIFFSETSSLNIQNLIEQKNNQTNKKYYDIFNKVFNHCIQFGIVNKTFWIFGNYENKYKLISFVYEDLKNGILLVNPTSIHDYMYDGDMELYNINDYVGTYYQNKHINFILFGCDECLKQLGECSEDQKEKYLSQFDLKLQVINLNTETNTLTKRYVHSSALTKQNKEYPLIPMLLQHEFNLNVLLSGEISDNKKINCSIIDDQRSGIITGYIKQQNNNLNIENIKIITDNLIGDDSNTYIKSFRYNSITQNQISGSLIVTISQKPERIWKLDKNNQMCFISYKSLSKYIKDGTFDYYFQFNPNLIKVQNIIAQWDQTTSYVDVGQEAKTHIMTFNFQKNKSVLTSKIQTYNIDEVLASQADKETLKKISDKFNNLTQCQLVNTKIKSNFSAFNLGYEYTDQFSIILTLLIMKNANEYKNSVDNKSSYVLSFKNMRSILVSKQIKKYAQLYEIFQNNSKCYTYNDLIYSYDKAIDIYQVVKQKQIYQIKRQQSSYTGKYSSIFDSTNEYFKKIPALGNCCIQPLNVKLVFKNDTGWTFLNDGVIDLDMGCYINDKIQRNKIVGYWQGYKNTNYIKWMGDVVNGGYEQVNVDIEKYILNHPVIQNKINKNLIEICFNVCWNQNSEITPDNVYIVISWNHVVQKYPITLVGLSSRNCDLKSFSIFIDKVTKEITIDQNVLYPVLKINYKSNLPDMQLGTINLNKNELVNLDQMNWIKYSKNIYYKKQSDGISYLFTNNKYKIDYKVNPLISETYQTILNQNIYIQEEGKRLSYNEIKMVDSFLKTNVVNDVYFDFVSYLNPKYFNKSDEDLNYKIKRILHGDLLKIYQSKQTIEKLDIFELSEPAFERIYRDVKRIKFKVTAYSEKGQYLTQQQKTDFNNLKTQLEILRQKIESIQYDPQSPYLQYLEIIKEQINEILKKF